MSAMRTESLRLPLLPSLPWWLLIGVSIPLAIFVSPIAGLGPILFFVVQRARPFDFLTSYLMVVVIGSFIDYGGGQTAFQMTILVSFIVFSLFCYVLSRRWDSLVFPRTVATTPLVVWFALTVANYFRGLVIGNSFKFANLEILAAMAVFSTFMVSSRKLSEAERTEAMIWMWVCSLLHFARGVWVFALLHRRTIGTYFTPVPGLIVMMLFNFALRARTKTRMALLVIAMAPLLTHQFLSYTRGFWLSIIGGIIFSLIVYVGRGEGAVLRARRSGALLLMLAAIGLVGVVVLSAATGVGGLLAMAGSRFASSTGTKWSWESSSNVIRLVESIKVLTMVIVKPWFGYGLGATFVVREPVNFDLMEQWFCHENYLLVTFKQGLLGLGLWLWVLISCVRLGVQGRSLPNMNEQAWCTGFGAMVIFIIVYGFVHFPMAETPSTFTFALAAGGAMRLVSKDTVAIRWKGRRAHPVGEG